MKQSESIAKLSAALVQVQQHITPIAKDRENTHFRNRYATLDSIMESVRAPLMSVGLAIVQGGGAPISDVNGAVCGVGVETMLVHTSGEFITSVITLPIAKPTPQDVGSAITYGRRYGICSLLALTTEEDDDGNAASGRQSSRPASSAPVTTQPAASTSAAKKMPFGSKRGTPLGQIDTSELGKTLAWAQGDEEKKEKFKDLIAAILDVLRERLAAENAAA